MRKYVMKRVSSMFSQSTDGIKATCTLLTLVQSARMNGLQPDTYVTYLLDHLKELDNPDKAEDFLPWSGAIPEDIRLDPAEVAKAEAEVAKEAKTERAKKPARNHRLVKPDRHFRWFWMMELTLTISS